jgi:SAM-dependent methyltransferase
MSHSAADSAAVPDFLIVTERGGEPVTAAQIMRLEQRYGWAGELCRGKDVLEMACGTGTGLGHLKALSRTLIAGDLSETVLAVAQQHYGGRLDLRQFDACAAPFPDGSFDVLILFEAIYYLSDVQRFLAEAQRLLRRGGLLLLATANKDLFDFNPSPYSKQYLNPPELSALLARAGFYSEFLGGSPAAAGGATTSFLRFVKRAAVAMRLIPRSMRGKRLLKRLVFGRLLEMPRELKVGPEGFEPPVHIRPDQPDTVHQVLYCIATKV